MQQPKKSTKNFLFNWQNCNILDNGVPLKEVFTRRKEKKYEGK